MLATISGLLSDLDINILDVSLDNQPGGQTICHFSIDVKNRDHLRRALNAVKGVKNVYRARRLHSARA
jgi:(p)ppGpp synthase/HD superfamily hydrolase